MKNLYCKGVCWSSQSKHENLNVSCNTTPVSGETSQIPGIKKKRKVVKENDNCYAEFCKLTFFGNCTNYEIL